MLVNIISVFAAIYLVCFLWLPDIRPGPLRFSEWLVLIAVLGRIYLQAGCQTNSNRAL